MRQKLTFLAILMMALAIPQNVKAYDFSYTYQGKTLYYNIVNGEAQVTYQSYNNSTNYNNLSGSLFIPSSVTINGSTYSVTSIGNYSFLYCSGLTSVTIPNSVITIGNFAFSGCNGLTSVTIPNSVTTIDKWAFSACSGLTSVIIPNSVTSINFGAFYGCNGLTSVIIPNSVTSIGGSAYSHCSSLISVTIGNSVTSIGDTAFSHCSSLATVNFNATDCTIMGGYQYPVFSECSNLTILNIGDNVTCFPAYAFKDCSNLTSVTIPNSVTSIGDYAFQSCSGLTSVTIGDSVTSIGNSAFAYCSGLTSVTIPNSVTSVGDYAFRSCSGLTSVTIPNSVTSIGEGAFFGCSSLTSVTIPNSVTSIGNGAFKNCSIMTTVNFNATDCTIMGSFEYPIFLGCSNLATLNIGDNVTSIPAYAFKNCNGLTEISCMAVVPPTLGGADVFTNVSTNIPVFVPCESITEYQSASGWSVFSNIQCNSVQTYTITVASANPTMGGVSGGGTYNEDETATLTATANNGYHFTHWQDGNTSNPRTVTVTGNATYTAYFEADGGNDDCPTITSFPWNATFDENLTCWKTVDADGDGYNWLYYDGIIVSESYAYFDSSQQGLSPDNWIISPKIEIPASGNYNLSWAAQGMNNSYYNEHYSVYVSTTGGNNPSDFTTALHAETLNTPNAVNRSKSLVNYRGQTIRIAFRHHNTNDVFVLGIANVKISQGTQGIDDIDENGLLVYVEGDNIHIDDVAGQSVTVYAIDGRIISAVTNATGCLSIPVAAAGVYIVKVGDHPARKVVVIR